MAGLNAPPAGTIRAAGTLALAGIALVMVPTIALVGTFAVVRGLDRRCPAPVVLRGSIAPERGFAKLEQPEDRP